MGENDDYIARLELEIRYLRKKSYLCNRKMTKKTEHYEEDIYYAGCCHTDGGLRKP